MSIKKNRGILMKKIKISFYFSLITLLWIMMYFGNVYASSVTMQREGALQKGQESAVEKNDVNMADNQLKFTPQRSRDKSDSAMESQAGRPSVRMERYKPSQEGEGERKIK
jgi:hypothetical protein